MFDSMYNPNQNIAQDAMSRVQALRNRLQGMQSQDVATGNDLTQHYAQQQALQRRQQMLKQQAQMAQQQSPQVEQQQQMQMQHYPQAPTQQPTGNVGQWISQALQTLKLGQQYAPGIAQMIKHESGGNPRAINKWDSNWKAGHPSMGLMQTIQPTFQRWALPGYNKNVYDPVSNIIAGIRYAQSRYGNNMLLQGGRRNSQGNYIGY